MLTKRELDVLVHVAQGKTSKEIGEEIHISENTVLKHMKNIYYKLEVNKRQKAVQKALSLNILDMSALSIQNELL